MVTRTTPMSFNLGVGARILPGEEWGMELKGRVEKQRGARKRGLDKVANAAAMLATE
jgi:hypothetical protein